MKYRRVGIVAGLGLVLLGVFAMGLLRRRLRFPYFAKPLSAEAYKALAARPGWEAISITVAPDVALRGLVRKPKSATAPWVIYYSGNTDTPLATSQDFLERLRGERDWGLAGYAYRGYDSSAGSPSRDALVADALRVFDLLCETQHIEPSRAHIVGFSLGTYFAAHVAGATAKAGKPAASLSLLGSFEGIDLVTYSWPGFTQRIAPGEPYDSFPYLDAVPAPVTVVHGTADEVLPLEQGRAVAARLGARARFVELPGVKHVPMLEAEGTLIAVRNQIDPR